MTKADLSRLTACVSGFSFYAIVYMRSGAVVAYRRF